MATRSKGWLEESYFVKNPKTGKERKFKTITAANKYGLKVGAKRIRKLTEEVWRKKTGARTFR